MRDEALMLRLFDGTSPAAVVGVAGPACANPSACCNQPCMSVAFRARLQPVPHGGQYVAVPAAVAERAGLAHAARVRGTVEGVPYRSSLMKYSGVFHLGLPKASLAQAGVKPGAQVAVTLERDQEPQPGDVVPADLERALRGDKHAAAAWRVLRPSRKRVYVQRLLTAKKAETRARRLQATLDALRRGEA